MAKASSSDNSDSKERTTVILRTEMIRNIKYIAFSDEKTQTDIIDEALTEYVTKWENDNGPIPKKA